MYSEHPFLGPSAPEHALQWPVVWEKGGWLCLLCWDRSRGNETYGGTFEFPILFHICIESIRVTGQMQRQGHEAQCSVKGRQQVEAKEPCLPSAETFNPRTVAPPGQGLQWWQEMLCD